MAINPTYDHVVVAESELQQTTKGGIFIASGADTGLKPGLVKAVGPDVDIVKPGDKIYLPWSDAKPLTIDGEKLAIIRQGFILGIVADV